MAWARAEGKLDVPLLAILTGNELNFGGESHEVSWSGESRRWPALSDEKREAYLVIQLDTRIHPKCFRMQGFSAPPPSPQASPMWDLSSQTPKSSERGLPSTLS